MNLNTTKDWVTRQKEGNHQSGTTAGKKKGKAVLLHFPERVAKLRREGKAVSAIFQEGRGEKERAKQTKHEGVATSP